jgi:hypothetical protein
MHLEKFLKPGHPLYTLNYAIQKKTLYTLKMFSPLYVLDRPSAYKNVLMGNALHIVVGGIWC